MSDSISALTGASQGTSAASSNKLNKDSFLKLMIEQLKNQDPMNPTDSAQYTAQLAQFSSLEQLQNINTSLSSSLDANYQLTQSINNTMSAALIGKEVKFSGSTIKYNRESSGTIGYQLDSDASAVKIKIYDKSGALVKTIEPSEKGIGQHTVEWDYKDSNGQKVATGDYSFKVEATSLNGKSLTVNTWTQGVIKGVRYTDKGTKFLIGLSEYSLSDVSEIIEPST